MGVEVGGGGAACVWEDGEEGEGVNGLRCGRDARRCLTVTNVQMAVQISPFCGGFSSPRVCGFCNKSSFHWKSSQHEALNLLAARLDGHRRHLASGGPGTPLDQVVRSPFSLSSRQYCNFFSPFFKLVFFIAFIY